MKIVCDSCSTKYSISDDKVRGKVFKIRCKKCSHIIVVRGTAEAAAAMPEAPAEAVWHLVVDGDQVGPLTDADVRARLARGEISVENYVWKEGFADWLRLAEVSEFADVVSATSVGGELFSDSARDVPADVGAGVATEAAGGFFGAGAAGQEAARASSLPSLAGGAAARTRAPALAASAPEEDAFSAPASPSFGSEGGDLFGAASPIAALAESGRVRPRTNGHTSGRHDGGRVESLTAQRSENSVLFSLSNLQSLAAPAAAANKPSTTQNTDGSGLIDIRAMAASTLRSPAGGGMSLFGTGSSKSDEADLPTFGAFSSAAPMLLPMASSSGPPKWVYLLVGLAALMIIAVGAAAFSILGRPVFVEQPAPPPVAPVPVPLPGPKAVDEKAATSPGSKPMAEGDLPPRENGEPAGANAATDKGVPKVGKKVRGKKAAVNGDAKSGAGVGVAGPAAPAVTPMEPEKPKPAKGSLDDLLEGALSGRKARPKVEDDSPAGKKAPGGEAAGGGGPLAKGAVVAGMNAVKAKVATCYAQFKVPGLAMVNVVIAKSGKVSSATVTGKFTGTPTGTCVEGAVKTASFPPSDGLNTPYPFNLR